MGAISKMSFAMDTTFHHVKPEHNYRAPEVVPSKLLLNEQQRKELGDILRNKDLSAQLDHRTADTGSLFPQGA